MMQNGKKLFMAGGTAFLTGLLVGGAMGVLYAPRSGARTRQRLRGFAEDVNERLDLAVGDTRRKMARLFGTGKRVVHG
jgi:gas vesicle protein